MAPKNAPPTGPGGLDLAGLASQGAAETDKRLSGQQSILDAYLNQVLGESKAGNAADSERQSRMHGFRRSQQLIEEQLNNRRLGQERTLQEARLAAQAQEADAGRGFSESQSAQERAFELGQAAVQRAEQEAAQQEDQRRWEAEFGLKEAALGAQGGGDPTTMSPQQASQTFGQKYVGADRGQYLNTRPAADNIRGRSFGEEAGGGGGGISLQSPFSVEGSRSGLPSIGFQNPFGGGGGDDKPTITNRTYQDLLNQAAEFAKSNTDPSTLREELIRLFGSETAASLALFDLGDLAAFPEPE